jgi:hypothetical protein
MSASKINDKNTVRQYKDRFRAYDSDTKRELEDLICKGTSLSYLETDMSNKEGFID